VYRNRRRIRGPRGLRLLRLRGERLERPFAHLYETGGMRRVHLRGHTNIRKRLLIHAGGFNLGLVMRRLIGVGTPRGLQGRLVVAVGALVVLIRVLWELASKPNVLISEEFPDLSPSTALIATRLRSSNTRRHVRR
jgi:transposase